jgi:hypothetical protein
MLHIASLLKQTKYQSPNRIKTALPTPQVIRCVPGRSPCMPPPGSHAIMSVASSLAGIDEALKRYALSVDEWRDDAVVERCRGGSEEYHARPGDPVCCLSILFFYVLYSVFIYRVTRLINASNSKKSEAGNIRESLLLNHRRFPSYSSLVGEPPSPSLLVRLLYSHIVPESHH